MDPQKLIDFLKSKNYYVDIQYDKNVVTVKFPEKKIDEHLSEYEIKYIINKKTFKITGSDFSHTIKCPKYAMYIAISYDIILRTQLLKICEGLLDFSKVASAIDCSVDDLVRQNTLLKFLQENIFGQILVYPRSEDLINKTKELDIYEGYDALIKVLGQGILYDKRLVKELVHE